MRVVLHEGALVFAADNRKEVAELAKVYKQGHVHFVCKAYLPNKRGTKAGLYLAPSVIRWLRPKGTR